MAVHVAGVGDAGCVATLLRAFNAEFNTPAPELDTLTRRLAGMLASPHAAAVLARGAEGPVGFALLTLRPSPYYEGPVAMLEELYVAPALRGRGIGTRMMAVVHEVVAAAGGGEIQINVDEVDTGARRFYERIGFTNVEVGQDYRMLCYIKEL
ncbi:GNAT family N-acetyltransferase [Corynebacterium bouchesdurhonense]|uniref:GNAT family N-acetyltransferase n=1 Tax=Corynebacterium bouchesdurhonense TaxID=1720192 RepID=UPI0008368B7D|nr:GNAT family N-acetyltransferase [Corynebacterium bouchesdurhonense]